MARKKKDEGGGGASWMDTYGDLVTLLLCFFVLLYSFSSMDQAKWDSLVAAFSDMPTVIVAPLDAQQVIDDTEAQIKEESFESMQQKLEELGALPQATPSNLTEEYAGLGINSEVQQEFDNLYQRMRSYVYENELETTLDLEKVDETIMLRFKDNMLFDSGKAELKPEALMILDDIVDLLADSIRAVRLVRVEGHTDNVPISNSDFADNWELSTARAWSVGNYIGNKTHVVERLDGEGNLIEANLERMIPESKLGLMGFGENRPLASNDNEAGRAQNRRVELTIEREYLTVPLTSDGDPSAGLAEDVRGSLEE